VVLVAPGQRGRLRCHGPGRRADDTVHSSGSAWHLRPTQAAGLRVRSTQWRRAWAGQAGRV